MPLVVIKNTFFSTLIYVKKNTIILFSVIFYRPIKNMKKKQKKMKKYYII